MGSKITWTINCDYRWAATLYRIPRNMVCFGYIIVNTLYKENCSNNMRTIVSSNERCDRSVCDLWRMVRDANIRTRHNVKLRAFAVLCILYHSCCVGRMLCWDPWPCNTCRGQLRREAVNGAAEYVVGILVAKQNWRRYWVWNYCKYYSLISRKLVHVHRMKFVFEWTLLLSTVIF